MICAACHATDFTIIPGVCRWSEVFACDNCGTLKVEVRKIGSNKEVEKQAKATGDS